MMTGAVAGSSYVCSLVFTYATEKQTRHVYWNEWHFKPTWGYLCELLLSI